MATKESVFKLVELSVKMTACAVLSLALLGLTVGCTKSTEPVVIPEIKPSEVEQGEPAGKAKKTVGGAGAGFVPEEPADPPRTDIER